MWPEKQFLFSAFLCTAFFYLLETQGIYIMYIMAIVVKMPILQKKWSTYNSYFRVDFMSLDIEGSELDVLRTIPFDKVHIELFLIEVFIENLWTILKLICFRLHTPMKLQSPSWCPKMVMKCNPCLHLTIYTSRNNSQS